MSVRNCVANRAIFLDDKAEDGGVAGKQHVVGHDESQHEHMDVVESIGQGRNSISNR